VRECLVVGTLSTDSIPSIQLVHLDDLSPVLDAEVEISNGFQNFPLTRTGSKWHAAGAVLQPDEQIHLKCQLADYAIEATTQMPPALAFTLVSNNLITINPNSTGSPALVVQWTELAQEDYSYLLKLEALGTELDLIPFTVPAGRFQVQYEGPISQTGTILFDTDFKYYGPHRLTVFAIPKEDEELFFYDKTDLRNLILLAPDNVLNAKGYFTSMSSASVDITLQ
jgi:hypothetical protein